MLFRPSYPLAFVVNVVSVSPFPGTSRSFYCIVSARVHYNCIRRTTNRSLYASEVLLDSVEGKGGVGRGPSRFGPHGLKTLPRFYHVQASVTRATPALLYNSVTSKALDAYHYNGLRVASMVTLCRPGHSFCRLYLADHRVAHSSISST